MSYVIQNFYKPRLSNISHHRLQLILCHNNIFRLYSFFKLYLMYINAPLNLRFNSNIWQAFSAGLFWKRMVFFESLFNIHSRLHLTTKFHRSVHISSLIVLDKLLKTQAPKKLTLVLSGSHLIGSVYFFPIKVIFTQLIKKIYKPLFVFFMLVSPLQWPVLSDKYFFSNTFFFVHRFFRVLYFENIKIFRTQFL